ncbi:MAG TPA: hypothetical protein VIL77_10360 [Gaiellaceae bacterium]
MSLLAAAAISAQGGTAVGDYKYELRRDNAVIATGRIQLDDPPSPGDMLSLGTQRVRVADVLHLGRTPRLILEAR